MRQFFRYSGSLAPRQDCKQDGTHGAFSQPEAKHCLNRNDRLAGQAPEHLVRALVSPKCPQPAPPLPKPIDVVRRLMVIRVGTPGPIGVGEVRETPVLGRDTP